GGEPPNPIQPPPGCRFHTRCPRATDVCKAVEPPLAEYPGGHMAACHHPLNVEQGEISQAKYSPLSPLSAGRLMPNGQEAPVEADQPTQARATQAQPVPESGARLTDRLPD